MDTVECINYLNTFSKFKGVFPRDLLPTRLSLDSGLIVNTDKASDTGEHWVSIYKYKNGETVYFDSFGQPPVHIEILEFLNALKPFEWCYNTIPFQSAYQDTCGMYCVYFLTCMFKYEDFTVFQSIFNSNTHYNDILAKIIYKVQEN